MEIITVKFNSSATKSYDYLLLNPKGVDLKVDQPLRLISGFSNSGIDWKQLTIVKKTRMDVLPKWVTSQIILSAANTGKSERIVTAPVKPVEKHLTSTKISDSIKSQNDHDELMAAIHRVVKEYYDRYNMRRK